MLAPVAADPALVPRDESLDRNAAAETCSRQLMMQNSCRPASVCV